MLLGYHHGSLCTQKQPKGVRMLLKCSLGCLQDQANVQNQHRLQVADSMQFVFPNNKDYWCKHLSRADVSLSADSSAR